MPDITALKNKYFVQSADAVLPSEPVPQTFKDNKITPLIDCAAYNLALKAALGKVGTGANPAANKNHFILIANWWLGLSGGKYKPASKTKGSFGPEVVDTSPYCLDGPTSAGGGTEKLIDILKDKAKKGVDVRVLGWVSFSIMDSAIAQKSGAGSIARVNALTMQSIKDLRAIPEIGKKAMLNIIGHTAGAVHSKLVVIGNDTEAIGFTGGLDFEEGRWAHPQHPLLETWHDVVAQVEGPAVQALFDWFKDMWWENIQRPVRKFLFEGKKMPHFLAGTPVLPARKLPTTAKGKHHVQSLRTVPQFKYRWYNCLPENKKISFAKDGIFEVKTALRNAILSASTYIYIEDQAFWSWEIMMWVRAAIKPRPNLRVILLTPGGADPNDPQFSDALLCNAINHGLLEGLTASQRKQIRMYRRMGDQIPVAMILIDNVTPQGTLSNLTVTIQSADLQKIAAALGHGSCLIRQGMNKFQIVKTGVDQTNGKVVFTVKNLTGNIQPATGLAFFLLYVGVVVHSKTTLVDDHWAIIGSANITRRSLYTDLEHCVSFLDEDDVLVKEYRKKLWSDHFKHNNPADFEDIQASLHAWESSWGTAGAAPSRPAFIEQTKLPITPDVKLKGAIKERYDKYQDVDSTWEWGGVWP